MRETCEPVLLERKAAKLRKSTNNPNLQARTFNPDLTPRQLLFRAIIRPTKLLLCSSIVLLLSLYSAFKFGFGSSTCSSLPFP